MQTDNASTWVSRGVSSAVDTTGDLLEDDRTEESARRLRRHVHRHLAVLVAIAAIGDVSTRELQHIVGRSRRAIQDMIRDLRACNVVIQSHQRARRHRYRLIDHGPYSVSGCIKVIRSKHPDIMNRILAVKAERDREHDLEGGRCPTESGKR